MSTMKFETPHRLLVDLVRIDDKHWPYCKKTGDYSKRDAEKEALIATRDAALTAKVREECADRAIEWYCNGDPSIDDPKISSEKASVSLRAAIVGKERENEN